MLKSSTVENLKSSEVKLSVDEAGPSAIVEDEALDIGRMPGDPVATPHESPESCNQLDQGWLPFWVKKKRSGGFRGRLIQTSNLTNLPPPLCECQPKALVSNPDRSNSTASFIPKPSQSLTFYNLVNILKSPSSPDAVLCSLNQFECLTTGDVRTVPPAPSVLPAPPVSTNLLSSAGHTPYPSRCSLLSKSKVSKGHFSSSLSFQLITLTIIPLSPLAILMSLVLPQDL
ncbi:hypothetical protein NE237_032596 [Protea cynaroides]|uniref:Uncharacterized protein n=1 Tax=Protea cynaroides TaxID=273540 RepID=A0A9Q0L4I7_9MAGN|nr:hypothetical protein NE237_032596 [Protea cynaroides]